MDARWLGMRLGWVFFFKRFSPICCCGVVVFFFGGGGGIVLVFLRIFLGEVVNRKPIKWSQNTKSVSQPPNSKTPTTSRIRFEAGTLQTAWFICKEDPHKTRGRNVGSNREIQLFCAPGKWWWTQSRLVHHRKFRPCLNCMLIFA